MLSFNRLLNTATTADYNNFGSVAHQMKMDNFHCQVVELSFRLKAEEIDKEGFFGRHGKTEDNEMAVIINSKEGDDQHSHIQVRFRSEDRVMVYVTFHNSQGDTDKNDDTPPHMEDCVPWLATFIKPDKVSAVMGVFYIFDKTFAPSMLLPFPLPATEETLAGCSVVGLSIQFPEDAILENAIIQRGADETAISVVLHKEIELKKFDLYEQLKELEPPVMSLVKKARRPREKRSKK
jgi:hypothetical protein